MLKHIKLTISKVNNVYEKYKEEKKGNYPKNHMHSHSIIK